MRPAQWTLLLVLLASCATPRPAREAAAPAPAPAALPAPPAEPIPALRLPPDVRPVHYTLELQLDPDQPRFAGTAAIEVALAAPRAVIWLHGHDLAVSAASVKAGSETLPAKWEQVNDDGVVKLTLPRAVGPGPATIEVAWTRAWDPRLVGLYLAREAGTNYAFTQFEDIFARRAFPGFDEPGFKTPFDVTLVVPKGAVAVANTAPIAEEAAGASKRVRFATTQPLPTYLLAWAVGPFDVVEAPTLPPNALRSWPVPMRGIAPKGRGGELGFALKTAAALLLQEEAWFGIPFAYPKLDSVAVPDYAYGAMENAGEIHYREDLLVFKEGVTAEETRLDIASVIAHEQAHQWFGDLVTMPWWEDAWLNESFATWMATQMVQQWKPEWNAASDLQKSVQGVMGNDALVTARAIRQPLSSVKDIPDQFDGITYQKGGAVLAMFERSMGAEAFRLGVRDYIAAHAHGSGSTDDLLASLSKAAGRDVATPFHTFLDQAGVPLVQARVSCAGKPLLTLQQSRFFPLGSTGQQDRSWQIPVCVRFAAGGAVREQCTLLTKPEQQVELPGCPDWLLPNADGAGYYRWSIAGDDLRKLRSAGYAQLNPRERISLASSLGAGVAAGTIPVADALEAFEPIARDTDGEVAAEALSLPGFARDYLVPPEERARVDAYTSALLAPVLARVGTAAKAGEPTATRRLRRGVLGLLARVEDKHALALLGRLGRAYAGLADGKFHPEAVDPDLAGLALDVAVEHGDAALSDALEKRLAAVEDGELRERVLHALASARDPARSAHARALALDPRLRKQEVLIPVFQQARDPRTREATWQFVQERFEAIAAAMPPTYASSLPYVAAGFCDAARAEEVAAFFGPRAAKYNGLSLSLRQASESMRLCAAKVEAQREGARAFFLARGAVKAKRAAVR